jgi:hypothetical protein
MSGFGNLLRAEWTKLRTVRGWVIGTVVGAVLMIGFGLLTGAGSHSGYTDSPDGPEIVGHPPVPTGPDGEAVSDHFTFVHQSLGGDGSITAKVGPLTGRQISANHTDLGTKVGSWAKAGLIVKQNTTQGSAYAAIMVTGGHGVRMQYNFTGDIPGPAVAGTDAVTWLRLTRSGETVTGYSSTDGTEWTKVGSARLTGLTSTVQSGLFVASPGDQVSAQHIGGGGSVKGNNDELTAIFDGVTREGAWSSSAWTGDVVAAASGPDKGGPADFQQSDGRVTITGNGDIAPDTGAAGTPIERVLSGAFIMLIVISVIAVLFITTEYRRGLIRTTFAASPSRGRVLAAKAIVVGAVTFVIGLAAAAVTVPLAVHLLEVNGNYVYRLGWATQARVVAGTAGVVAVSAVLALAVGTMLRRTAGAIAAVVVLVVLPYLLSVAAILPAGPSQWLLRLTPAAGFAIQQSIPEYHQVDTAYWPAFGFFPLSPWAGFAVLCGYAALALGFASFLLRRRDV